MMHQYSASLACAVVALYALWLNDRRRRVEERRQEVERQRHELELQRSDADRTRVADERFAKAVELLGNDADQVRVGALHALAGLARNREEYRQTVRDVLCSYLRRPFKHPRYEVAEDRHERDHTWSEEPEEDQELQVRLTAQRNAIDQAMFDPASAEPALAKLTMTDLLKRRAEIETRIEAAEADWLEASEALDAVAA